MNEQQFLQMIAEALDSSVALSRGLSLESLAEWDSLGVLSILDFLESEGVNVELDQLRDAQTTDDLIYLAASIVENV